MGRTAGARDGSQRKRRGKTQAEKDATAEAKRKKMAKGTASITDLFRPTTTNTNNNTQQDGVDNNRASIAVAANPDTQLPNEDQDDNDNVIVLSESIDDGRGKTDEFVANLDVEDGEGAELDDEADAEDNESTPTNTKRAARKRGIQQDYMRAVQNRLKCEVANKTKGFEASWLLDHLKENDWWVRKEHALAIVKQLKSERRSPSTYQDADIGKHNPAYYRSIKVWIPELMWGNNCRPFCPTCHRDDDVKSWGFNTEHVARLVIGVTENYYIMTRRYKCTGCERKKKELEDSLQPGEKVKPPKYTFMGWNPESLPPMAFGCGDEFPAVLSWKAGLDKTLVDMMRSQFVKGVRPETFSDNILEWHAKNYTRSYLKYERGIAMERHNADLSGNPDTVEREMFSAIDDKEKWNEVVPTGKYFAQVYKNVSATLRPHFTNEAKKRGGLRLAIDASFKSAGHMSKVKGGASVFNGLITATNEHGEVRIQHHVVSDSHDQMKAPLQAFSQTTKEYGLPPPELASTDNPSRDTKFLLETFESLREQKKAFNSSPVPPVPTNNTLYPYDADAIKQRLKVVESKDDINQAATAVQFVMNKEKGLALDCEWRVEFLGHGRKNESKIGLIQLAYFNKEQDNRKQYLLIRTHLFDTLPHNLINLLTDNTFNIVGVNVGGDMARIARDFKISSNVWSRRTSNTVINLGMYARKRDVVQNGTVGMKVLVKAILGYDMKKSDEDRFSDWNTRQKLSPAQEEYAIIDVSAPLDCYEKLQEMPDLTLRLRVEDATVGKRVDIVPRNGSVACMATRAATGCIIDANVVCQSPEGIVQQAVRAGSGMATVQIEQVYSPGLKIPHYKKTGLRSHPITLADFGVGKSIVLPVQMLKDHVSSDSVREYPIANNASVGLTLPSVDEPPVDKPPNVSEGTVPVNNEQEATRSNEYEEYPPEDQVYESMASLTSKDIEMLRASTFAGAEATAGRLPLVCDGLDDPPQPGTIRDVFSPVLGDVYHGMDRPYVPVKHESKKSYFVGLQNAFYEYDEDTMAELERHMRNDGLDNEQIESKKYYNSRLFLDCVPRKVPPPSILYWRVRAVFALYGNVVDSKTNKPLFNAEAWKKAKGVLREILLGYYSDPPGMEMYTKKLSKDGSVKKNKYGMELIECMRGTNRTEAYHKNLAVTFNAWHTGIEMSDALLMESMHRYNHRCSERRRLGFPKLAHFDTWLVDQLQNLVLDNHGQVLYPNWSNASDYVETNERFHTVSIHSADLDKALKEQCETKVDMNKVKLTSDQKYLCASMNTKLPLLPFITEEENKLFADCVLNSNFPTDDNEAAIAWCKFVDGIKIWPKLGVHMRLHREEFQRNQRVRDCVERAKAGKEKLDELFSAMKSDKPNTSETIPHPKPLPEINAQATHASAYVVVGGTAVGNVPAPSKKRRNGERGQDAKPRARKRCMLCANSNNTSTQYTCSGSGARKNCLYWNEDGTPKYSLY